jgi:NADH-quinone oxidoreductase subunit G
VYRLLPRENEAVNKSWLCDEGRLTYNRSNTGRIHEALVRDGAFLRGADADEATRAAGALLNPCLSRPGSLAVALSLHASNEEALGIIHWAQSMGAHRTLFTLGYPDGEADTLLRHADKNPNRAGIARVAHKAGVTLGDQAALAAAVAKGEIEALVVLGSEADGLQEIAELGAKLRAVIQVSFAKTPLTDVAHVTLPSLSWVENDGTWLSGEQRLQLLTPAFAPVGASQSTLRWLDALSQAVGHAALQASSAAWQIKLAAEDGAFAGVDFGAIGPLGLSLADPHPLAASA